VADTGCRMGKREIKYNPNIPKACPEPVEGFFQ
jgi:hypothetical protein